MGYSCSSLIQDQIVQSNIKCVPVLLSSVQFSSVIQSCTTLCDPMNHSLPGLPVHHQLPEFTQARVHWVSDAIQPSHPLSSPSPPAPNPSQHQSLFQWVNSSHEVSKVLELQLQHHSFQRNPRADLLQNGLVGSPCSPRALCEHNLIYPFHHFGCWVVFFNSHIIYIECTSIVHTVGRNFYNPSKVQVHIQKN